MEEKQLALQGVLCVDEAHDLELVCCAEDKKTYACTKCLAILTVSRQYLKELFND